MGDLQVCSAQRESFVRAREDCLYGSTTSSFESNPDPSSITKENWEAAERRTNEILCKIRPTLVADKKRREVIQYVRDLITGSLGCEVFPYGSVPLKTYLPDGDIDLTAISTPNFEDTLVSDVHAVLKSEEHTKSAHYEVKDVHIIDAEVKLVKCLVQNIVVDISFNQLGGLSTLCFLELVDGIIGKDHLFKRSIILIKAWCYYESRILGAHHGLLSTYALETLVLYIFHLFHSSLDGPLAVLYRFLYYFSKFDWENYCVSLNGPVCKSSLADIVVRGPENGREGLLLSEEFLQECFDKFSVSSRGMETDSRAFPQKHLNIIDVLKENNNLGRSVNRGNSYRIRSAFKYGARKLGQILMLPNERLADELNKFLANTLQRRGDEYWTDVQHFAPAACSRSADCLVSTEHYEDSAFLRSSGAGYGNDKTSGFRNNQKGHSLKAVFTQAVPKLNCTSAKIAVPRSHHSGNAKAVAPGILSSRNRDDSSSCLSLSTNFCASLSRKSQQTPRGNVKVENGSPRGIQARSVADDDMSFALWPESKNSSMTISSIFSSNNHENIAPNILPLSTAAPNNMENAFSTIRDRNSNIVEKSESLKPLLDLSGHYENCFSNLIYAKNYHVSAPVLLSPTMSHQLQSNNLWEMIWQSVQLEPKAYSKMNASSDLGTQFYPVNPLLSSNAVFTAEDRKRSRGTGTYFPKMNYHSNGDRPLSGRGRFNTTGAYGQRPSYKNGLVTASTETNFSVESLVIASTERKFSGEGSRDLSQEDFPVLGNGKSGYSDAFRPQSSVWGSSKANGFFHQSERHEPGFCEVRLGEVPLPEVTAQLASDTSPCLDSASVLEIPAAQSPNSVTESNQESNADFHLKNEIEFPSLSLGEKVKI